MKSVLIVSTMLMSTMGMSPEDRAKDLVSKMTLQEKTHYLHGSGQGYVGNVEANDRLGIPALKLNDGPQGFRDNDHLGTTTAFPCALSIAASFDEDAARTWGTAMGLEFYQKGANVQLGPGMCVARVPRNGRNFEYLSGEDPYLGSRMVGPVIEGIQSQNVVANAKHYVNNNQETDRTTDTAVLSERAEFEMYLPPFEAAVSANVGSIMCSYNKIAIEEFQQAPGFWSCENNHTLNTYLRDHLGFKGFVMSDWGATHSMSINQGLDQEMPGNDFMSDENLAAAVQNGTVLEETIDQSVLRILTPFFQVGAFDNPTNGSLNVNVTSEKHNAIARDLAAKGTVLLKNEGNVLPWDASSTVHIAVIGSEALTPNVHGGGSGQVISYYVSSPLDAIREKLGITSGVANSTSTNCDPSGKRCVTYAYSAKDAVEIATKADVAIVFGMTTSSEGGDRGDLNLNDGADDLIAAVAKAQPQTIAVAVTPGALLTPWSDDVKAAIVSFMPGQEYGHAVADILFGDVNPSAKLPVTMPNVENEMNFSDSQWPGVDLISTYSEDLLVGYRYYAAKHISPKFCFGHGLSYTKFEYDSLEITSDAVMFEVKNVGDVDGDVVPQMYFELPDSAGEPPLQLKGFQKTHLKAGESSEITFNVTDRTVSIWNTTVHDWSVAKGKHKVYVGESSCDIRLRGTFTASA